MPSRGPKRGQNCYITPIFSGVPYAKRRDKIGHLTRAFSGAQKRAEWLRTLALSAIPNAKRGDRSRIGHLTRGSSGAQKRAGLLRNPCSLGVPYVAILPCFGPRRRHG